MIMEAVTVQPTMQHKQQQHIHHGLAEQMMFKPALPDVDPALLGTEMRGPPSNHGSVRGLHQNGSGPFVNQMNRFVMVPSQPGNRFGPQHATPMPVSDQFVNQLPQHYMPINPNGNPQFSPQKTNKRGSVDYTNGMLDYSKTVVESWMNSPHSVTSDDSLDNSQNQGIKGFPKGLANYPNNVKRQNVGQCHVSHNLPPQLINQSPRGINGMPHMTFSHLPVQSNIPMMQSQAFMPAARGNVAFYGAPRILDLQGQVSPNMQQTRHPVQYILQPRSHVMQPFSPRMPIPSNPHPAQHTHYNAPMGRPSAGGAPTEHNSNEKKARFLRTAQILEQSGLMECTLKTAALMKENTALQREIDALTAETEGLIAQYLNAPRDVSHLMVNQMPQQMFQQHFSQQQAMPASFRQGTVTSMTPMVPYHSTGMI